MKKSVFFLAIISVILTSCKTSNDVYTSSVIQKRKYTKGYHLNNKLNKKYQETTETELDFQLADVDESETLYENESLESNSSEEIAFENNQLLDETIVYDELNEENIQSEVPTSKLIDAFDKIKPNLGVKSGKLVRKLNDKSSTASPAFNGGDVMSIMSLAFGAISIILGFYSLLLLSMLSFFTFIATIYAFVALVFSVLSIIFGISGGKKGDSLTNLSKIGKLIGVAGVLLSVIVIVLSIL
jgi:hypothetical protein